MLEQVSSGEQNSGASCSDWKGKGKARVSKDYRAKASGIMKDVGRLADELTRIKV